MKAAWSVSSWTCLPRSLGAGQGGTFPVQEGHSTCRVWGPPRGAHGLNSAHFTSCALCLWVQGQEKGHGPWGSASPLLASRGKAEIPEILSIPVRKRRVWLQGCTAHKNPPPSVVGGRGTERDRVCLQTQKFLQGQ